MDDPLNQLADLLRQQAEKSGFLTLDKDTLRTPGLDELIRDSLALDDGQIIISEPGPIPNPDGEQLKVSGQTTFLNVENRRADVTFVLLTDPTTGEKTIQFTLQASELPSKWSFGVSFEDLLGSPADLLTQDDPAFYFSTYDLVIDPPKFEAIRGLNFASDLSLDGPFDLVQNLLSMTVVPEHLTRFQETKDYVLAGAIERDSSGSTILKLKAHLNIDVTFGFIRLKQVFVAINRIYFPCDDDDSDPDNSFQNPYVNFGAMVSIKTNGPDADAEQTIDIILNSYLSTSARGVMIGAAPAKPANTTLDRLHSIMGAGNTWDAIIPAWFRDGFLRSFGLKYVNLYLSLGTTGLQPSLLLTQVTVGTLEPLEILPDDRFKVSLDAQWSIYSPESKQHTSITFSTRFALSSNFVFDVELVLEPDHFISATGTYQGGITFTLAEMSDKLFEATLYNPDAPKIPGNVAKFTFSDFYLSVVSQSGTKTFSFGARAEADLQLFRREGEDVKLWITDVTLDVITTYAGDAGYEPALEVAGTGKNIRATIQGTITIAEFDFMISAEVGSDIDTIFTIAFGDWSLGDLIRYIVGVVRHDEDYALPAPWNKLNTIELKNLSIDINLSKRTFGIKYSLQREIDFGFLKITEIDLFYDSELKEVILDITGNLLGKKVPRMNLLDDETIPQVPGAGNELLDLRFLGMGQHVALYNVGQIKTVLEAIGYLENAFEEQPSDKVPIGTSQRTGQLYFNPNSSWLIGTRFIAMGMIDLSIVFNDPELYGLLISLSGERAKKFAGLSFEIMYRKITDSIGVYQLELKLPDAMRELQFGAMSFTLPVVAIAIYTNGNFKIDFGFPANKDFSRSLTVQLLPFIGSGGFYFALLGSETATRLPAYDPERGTFNPVIEFGIGMRLGIGKTIDKGVFMAGLSITFEGIVEGRLAFFNYNRALCSTPSECDSLNLRDDVYYWLCGTFTVVGKIYGSIDFAIIQAEVNLKVYATISVTIEAYAPIYLYLEAGIEVQLTVKISLGLFKINIHLSFKATIRESFTLDMGGGTPPWSEQATFAQVEAARPRLTSLNRPRAVRAVQIDWKPIALAERVPLAIYFLPQITAAVPAGTDATQHAYYVAMLFLKSSIARPGLASEEDGFDALAEAVLLWAISSLLDIGRTITEIKQILDETVTPQDLDDILAYLAGATGGISPIAYDQIIAFLESYFDITLMVPPDSGDAQTFDVSVFPMIPELTMTTTLNGVAGLPVHFSRQTPVPPQYHADILTYFEKLVVAYENELEKRSSSPPSPAAPRTEGDTQALPIYIFQDYFVLLARALIQNGIDLLKSFAYTVGKDDTLQQIAGRFTIAAEQIATANQSVPLVPGVALDIAGVTYPVQGGDSLRSIAAKYLDNPSDTYLEAFGGLNEQTPDLLIAGVEITVNAGTTYKVVARDTLLSIAVARNTSSGQLALLNADRTDILQPFTVLALPAFNYAISSGDSFENIANTFKVSVEALARANLLTAGIFPEAKGIVLPNLQSLQVGVLVQSLAQNNSFKHLSGMAARYMLHGLRLPDPDEPEQLRALYDLTGQQVELPPLAATDVYVVALDKDADAARREWFTLAADDFNHVKNAIKGAAIDQVEQIRKTVLDPPIEGLAKIRLYKQEPQRFPLRDGQKWQTDAPIDFPQPADQVPYVEPSVWPLPANLIQLLNEGKALLPRLGLIIGTQQHSNRPMQTWDVRLYRWGTALNLAIRQASAAEDPTRMLPFTYLIEGSDTTGIDLLERVLTYAAGHNAFIDHIYILYPPNPAGDNPKGIMSDGIDRISSFILQTNLSNLSNPQSAAFLAAASTDGAPVGNQIDQHAIESLKLLWECSIVRSGGYYLYYRADARKAGLPDSLFNKEQSGLLTILITYTFAGDLLPDFVNTAVIGDRVGEASSVFAISLPQQVMAAPGKSLGSLLQDYRLNTTTLGALIEQIELPNNATINMNDVIFQLDSDTWTFEKVGEQFGKTAAEIQAANPGVENLTTWTALNIPPFVYTVKGDHETLPALAARYGVSPAGLIYANPALSLRKSFVFEDQSIAKTATIPAGNTGFTLQRSNRDPAPPEARDAPVDPAITLELIYNLLSYAVVSNVGFAPSNQGKPIGSGDGNAPPDPDPNADTLPRVYNTDPTWSYEQIVPVAPFARGLPPAAGGAPDPARDPYLGIGRIFQVHLDWQDSYGNQTYTPFADRTKASEQKYLNDFPIRIGYFDPLVGIDRWASVNTGYIFSPGPTLEIHFTFDPNRYVAREAKDAALADSLLYATIYYQLGRPDTRLTLASTLDSATYAPDTRGLIDFVGAIYAFLRTISAPEYTFRYYTVQQGETLEGIATALGVPLNNLERLNPGIPLTPPPGTALVVHNSDLPPDFVLSQPTTRTNQSPKFPLTVTLDIRRAIGRIDDDFKDTPAVGEARYTVNPLTRREPAAEVGGDESAILSLRAFAAALEGVFDGIKVAVGSTRADLARKDSGKQVWLVSIGAGGQVQYRIDGSAQSFFAQIPLKNQLITGNNFTVYDYIARQGMNYNQPVVKTFSAVDLDVWAKAFLIAVDDFLSPEYVVPAFIVDQRKGTSYYQSVLDDKRRIATVIAGLLQPIADQPADPNGLAQAREALKQQLLVKLANGYTIDAVAQFQVDISLQKPFDDTQPPRLFGNPLGAFAATQDGNEDNSQEYALSTARIPLEDDHSNLTFFFSAKQAQKHRTFPLKLSFQATALEHDIHSVLGIENYAASAWLTFVIPPPAMPFTFRAGAEDVVAIPVPLRAYPIPPSLLKQTATPSPIDGTAQDLLQQTRQWYYSYKYEPAEAEQDTIYTNILFNVLPPSSVALLDERPRDLFEALALFTNAYAAIQNDFVNVLRTIDEQSSQSSIDIASGAVQALQCIVHEVAAAWGNWLADRGKYDVLPQDRADYQYRIVESDADGLLQVAIADIGKKHDLPIPLMVFPEYNTIVGGDARQAIYRFQDQANPEEYLTWSQRLEKKQRRLVAGKLDIFQTQNAWAGVYVTRNENLFATAENPLSTNPNFIYQTPAIYFSNIVTPLLSYAEPIDIGGLSPAPRRRPLLDHLSVLFESFFGGLVTGGETTERQIKLTYIYTYTIGAGTAGAPLRVELPVGLVPPFSFHIPADAKPDCATAESFICRLNEQMRTWYERGRPSTAGGMFVFSVEAFSSLSESKLPVYQVRTLFLQFEDISDLEAA